MRNEEKRRWGRKGSGKIRRRYERVEGRQVDVEREIKKERDRELTKKNWN